MQHVALALVDATAQASSKQHSERSEQRPPFFKQHRIGFFCQKQNELTFWGRWDYQETYVHWEAVKITTAIGGILTCSTSKQHTASVATDGHASKNGCLACTSTASRLLSAFISKTSLLSRNYTIENTIQGRKEQTNRQAMCLDDFLCVNLWNWDSSSLLHFRNAVINNTLCITNSFMNRWRKIHR